MSTSFITLVGRLAQDPEKRTTNSGTSVCQLTIPVDTGWGDNKSTTWWRVSLFGKRADSAAQYLSKGSWVSVSGPASVREYDKRDGSKGLSAEVAANDWAFVGPKQSSPEATAPQGASAKPVADYGSNGLGDGLPF